jgi:hypothetical protein
VFGAKMVQLIENFQEVTNRTSHAIERPHHHDIEVAAAGILHQFVEAGAAGEGRRPDLGLIRRLTRLADGRSAGPAAGYSIYGRGGTLGARQPGWTC